MIAGGSEAAITPLGMAGFNNMKALSSRNENPEKASRPFDSERDGFVMGEGGGIFVLEELEHAKNRGAKIYAELTGLAYTADAYHITAPDARGIGATNVMKSAIKDAGLKPSDIDYINAHGTSTPFNDKIESFAIEQTFGSIANEISISSTKSMIGHLLGASGAVESIICVFAIRNNIIPPTINYEFPDPDCRLNYTPNNAVEKEVNIAITNSFGFGGHNACLVIESYQDKN